MKAIFNSTYPGNYATRFAYTQYYPLINNGGKFSHLHSFNYLEVKEKIKKSCWQTSLLTGPESLAES